MAISANSIIHYTQSFEILKAILKDKGFKLKYCVEKLELGNGYSNTAHPMVSFCDIPLSNSVTHSEAYGKYAIGLTKSWAFEKKINPVLYIDRHSSIADTLHKLLLEVGKSQTGKIEIIARNGRIKSGMKNYEGVLDRQNQIKDNYKFYNEREWRFVPGETDADFKKFSSAISIKADEYIKNKDKFNQQISKYRLEFCPDDISYIIVKSTQEIPELIKFLRESYPCTGVQLDLLLSRVCSMEQIVSDY